MLHQVFARRPEPRAFPPLVSGGQLNRHLFRGTQHQERTEIDPGVAPGIDGSSKREAWREEAHHCEKHARCMEDFACGWWAVQGSNL
jgi:hypothetical protein